jgi:hypothetical protein
LSFHDGQRTLWARSGTTHGQRPGQTGALAVDAGARHVQPRRRIIFRLLPATVAASNPNLSSLRSTLMQERETLHGKIDSLNALCASVAKGSAAAASCLRSQAELRAALNSHIQQSRNYNAVAQAAIITSPSPAPLNDPSVVDARNVATGLPKSVEAEIPDTPAGNRVRKGFEAIMEHDWNVAHAWFQDALNHDPDNAGIQRLIDLAEYTMNRAKQPPRKPVADTSEQDKAAMKLLDQQLDAKMDAELAKLLNDFNRNYDPASAERSKPANKDGDKTSVVNSPPAKLTANWSALFSPPSRAAG